MNKHYVDRAGNIYAYAADGSDDAFIAPGLSPMTDAEFLASQEKPLSPEAYDEKLMEMFQASAVAMGYKSWETCSLRAYKPGPFSAECTAFFDWMEACNTKAYSVLADFQSGKIKQPTITEFLEMMPKFERPGAL